MNPLRTSELEGQDEKSIRDIVHLYNQREGVTYLYKATDQLPWTSVQEEENPNRRHCIIRETECLKSENPDLSQCDFKPDGDVKICAVDLGDEDPEDIMCTSLTKNVRVRRASKKKKKKCKSAVCKILQTVGGGSIIGSATFPRLVRV
ncbi:uncharacterized protein LOC130272815 isoform X2 [Hyla sarda]|uniref:uncharacterized protein LOC130272815 isoform X2 n=1 Tax=Hyla sarda TaxID=327740 RepID=UPI0024C271F7|nr:uncharacterized protein LOC130272815 isoform X2 [Hyla sarda]